MVKYLEKRMYVNNIDKKNLLKIASIIEKYKKKPEIFTSQAEVLHYFWLLINGNISIEKFLMFNDTCFFNEPYKYPIKNSFDAIYYVKNLPDEFKINKIFIFDILYEDLIKKEGLKNSFVV